MTTTKKSETEKALAAYSQALEQADFETMGRIHHQAETDPELEQALSELLAADAEAHEIPAPTTGEVLETQAMVRGLTRRGPPRN